MKPFFLFLLLLPCVAVSGLAYSASAYAVLDADTGVLLDSANAGTQLPMASTTKIMTGLLAAEDADPDRSTAFSARLEFRLSAVPGTVEKSLSTERSMKTPMSTLL